MKIICFGDSITRGYDVRPGHGWVELCSAALPAYHMENHGIDGLSVQGLINYLESWCIDKSYEDDRYICIMCGTNDILQNRDSDYVYNKLIKAVTMASEKVTALVEEVKGLTVLELSELVHALEDEFGVSAAAPVAVAAAAAPASSLGLVFPFRQLSPAARVEIGTLPFAGDLVDHRQIGSRFQRAIRAAGDGIA